METTRSEPILGPIRLLFEVGTVAGMSDGQLLDRFLDRRGDDEAAEVAFAALVERHGPMVLRVCRARLGDEHDAQDAFQATFLILARKAGLIRKQESAASWLQGVARRVASCSRRAAAVRRAKERKAAGGRTDIVAESDRSELIPAVREEVGDLPEKYRIPLMLCLLDGLTHEEAATRLGWPLGTVKTRVRRAKDKLRVALTRRGLAPSIGAIGAALAAREASAMPANLVRATARVALNYQVGRSTALLSASVARLVELGMGSLIMTRLKMMGLVVASIGVLAAGATGVARQDSKPQEKPKPAEKAAEAPHVLEMMPDGTVVISQFIEKSAAARKLLEAGASEQEVQDAAEKDMLLRKRDELDQLEMARLQLEIGRVKVAEFKNTMIDNMKRIEGAESQLKAIRSAKNLDELRTIVGYVQADIDLEAARKNAEDWVGGRLNNWKEGLKRTLAKYTEMKRELAQEELRLNEREALAAVQVLSSPVEAAGGVHPADDERLGRIEASRLDIELLEMEVTGLKQNVLTALQVCLNAKEQMRSLTTPPNPMMGGFGGGGVQEPLTGQAREDAKKLGQEFLDYAQKSLEEARLAYLSKNRDLKREQKRLADLEKQAGTPETRSAQPATTPEPKQPAEIEARLSDVERKLDQILKAVKK